MTPADTGEWLKERLQVLRAQQGNRAAFRELVESYDRKLVYFICKILGTSDGALDVAQTVWMTVHRKLGGLKSADAFRTWLYRLAHDAAVTELRKRTRLPLAIADDVAANLAEEMSDDADLRERVELVHQALQVLTVDQRRLLTLRFLEEMSVDEIAEVIGCRDGTVKSRLHYAKRALRRRIEELIHG